MARVDLASVLLEEARSVGQDLLLAREENSAAQSVGQDLSLLAREESSVARSVGQVLRLLAREECLAKPAARDPSWVSV